MKICLVGTIASSTINFRTPVIELLIQQGHQVYVLATDYDKKTRDTIHSLGAHPIDYDLNRGGINPFSDIKNTISLKKIFKEIKPDIVFSYFSKPVIFSTIAAKLARVPRIVGMLEGLGYTFTLTPNTKKINFKKLLIKLIQIQLYKLSFKFLDRLIFLNNDDYHELIKANKIKIIDCKILGGIGVDLNKFNYLKKENTSIKFLFIGRLLQEKGIIEFLNAAKKINIEHPNIEFIILGDIDIENPSSLNKYDLGEIKKKLYIHYPGHVTNIKDWLHTCSAFVLPSYREGVPCSTQEAMACGCPIITTDVPGCRETVEHGINGFLVPPFDDSSLASAMIKLAKNPEIIKPMGFESRKKAENEFDGQKQSFKLIEFIIKK